MDTSSFCAPARIQVLLVPIHPIKRSKFERYAELIRGFGKIPLCDVPGDRRGERAIFSSSPTTPGSLLFSYQTPTTYASSHPLSYLNEFQIHRRIHGIIGILDASEFASSSPSPSPSSSSNDKRKPTLQSGIDTFQKNLKELPQTFTNKIYGFEPSSDQIEEGRGLKMGAGEGEEEAIVMVPTTGDLAFYLNTLLADFASGILWEFSALAAQLESRSTFPTPQETSATPSPFTYISRPTASSTLSSYTSQPSHSPAPSFNLNSFGISPPPQSRTSIGLFGNSTSGNQDGFLYGMSIASNMQVQSAVEGGNGVVDMKARKKVVGREKKLLGDLWLLSGRVGEAIKCYEEAILNTKSWHDSVWQASALEGICVAMVVQAWGPNNTRFSMQPPVAPGTPPPGPIDTSTFLSSVPEKMSAAISLYSKLLPSPSPPEDAPPPDPDRANPLIYAEACLRCARFLLAVWETSGWIDRALEMLVLPNKGLKGAPQTSAELAREAKLTSLKPSNTVPRSSIATWVSMAYSPTLALMSLPIRLRVSGEIASIFGKVGYRRKEAFVLRELAALCGEGVAGRGIEVFTTETSTGKEKEKEKPSTVQEESEEGDLATPLGGGGMKKKNKPSLTKISPLLLNDRSTPSIVRTTSDSAGNDSIIRVAEKVCEAFGVRVVSKAKVVQEERIRKRMSLVQGRAKEIEDDGKREFGWPILQVGVLRDAISIAEALPDYQAAIRFTVTALRALSTTMPPAEQYRLSQNIPRIFAAATRRGAAFELEYWGPSQLVMSLEVAPLLPNRLPSERSYKDVEEVDSVAAKNPFIYNPNRRGPAAAKARPIIVQNEIIEVFVTLQNPFLFDLDVQSIELSTSGVPFACEAFSTTVPPGSFHTVRLLGTPHGAGLLTIRGCNIRLAGCTNREFVLPVWSDAQEAKRQKSSLLDTSRDRVKNVGLEAFGTKFGAEVDEEGFKFLECDVVGEMPILWMRSTNLTHGALMLYDGENSTIRIGLENTSTSPVNFLKLTFTDSFTTATQAYVEENDLAPGEAFEILSDNLNRPVFTWTGDHDQSIAPGAFKFVEVQCMGKVGCGSGMIQIDYAHLDRDANPSSNTFHTRQLFCPVYMTVHRALVGHSLDILSLSPLPPSVASFTKGHGRSDSLQSLGRRGAALDSRLEEELREPDGDGEENGTNDKCLVVVEIGNNYGQPFEVTLERKTDEDGNEAMKIRERLEPGATARILLPLSLLRLPLSLLQMPIPSLSTQRQFVISSTTRSVEEERMERELFWYREELLKRIKGSWNEVGSLRSGSISLRSLRLTKPMLDLLRADEVEIDLALVENEGAEPDAFRRIAGNVKGRVRYEARANEFVDVKIRVRNNSADPIKSIFHLFLLAPTPAPPLPSPNANPNAALSHLYRYLVIDGLSTVPLSHLQPGEEEEVRISICLLAEGTWEFKGEIDEVRDNQAPGKQMRKYVARDKLVIEVSE